MNPPTFSDIYTKIEGLVWPDRIPRNLKALAQDWLKDCLNDIQLKIPYLHVGTNIIYRQEDTYYLAGVSIVDAPAQTIKRVMVRTIEDPISGNNVNADYVDEHEMNARMNYQFNQVIGFQPYNGQVWAPINWYIPTPQNPNAVNQWGMLIPDPSIDRYVRQDVRVYSVFQGFLWLWPWLNSNQEMVIEVKGIKTQWAMTDVFPDTWISSETGELDQRLIQLMEEYMAAKRHRKEEARLQEAAAATQAYQTKLSDLIIQIQTLHRPKSQGRYYPRNES